MPKVTKIGEEFDSTLPLRVFKRKRRGRRRPSIRIKCGCCDESIVIFYSDEPTGHPNIDTIEINGVMGTVSQWEKILDLVTKK